MADCVEINGTQYELDFRGHLKDFNQWSPDLMNWYAEKEEIELTEDHLKVIDYLRTYFQKNKAYPVVRGVTAEMGEKISREKGTVKCFHTLFPTGIHQAYMIAGLPRMLLSV